jgi:hypothetical protein
MNRYMAIALVLCAAGSAQAAEKTLERTFTVSPAGLLVVDADSASVQITGASTDRVTLSMSLHGSDADLAKTTLDAVQNAGGVTITMRRPQKNGWFNWTSWNSGGQIRITVPHQYRVDVRTSGERVELADTVGSATLRTSGGDISAKGVTGSLEARTSGGGIFAETIRGDVDARTSGGDVHLLSVDGKINAKTSGGSVHCSLVGANRGIVAKTSGGSIELTLPRATTGGIVATTSGGDVSVDLPISTTTKTTHHLAGPLNGGGEPIDLSTSGGDISVRAAH